ncbi:MAG: lipoprotein [Planctomycetaceae bacterium]|nr:lipoprotein [Planctomycetaceae bacterium]
MRKFFYLLFALVVLTGCDNNVPLSGHVTFSDNGEVLTAGTVVFVNGATQARGEIQPNGSYVLGFEDIKNGLPSGTYSVYIDNANRYEGGELDANGIPKSEQKIIPLINEKHTKIETAGLTVEVNGSLKKYDIKVERP